MHCCDAFSLSQSVLSVGSQDVAWIWDRRPAPARLGGAPWTPKPMLGGKGGGRTAGPERLEFTAWLRTATLSMTEVILCAMAGDTAARPVSAAAAGGGEVGLAPLAVCPGRECPKLADSWAPLPWLVPTAPLGPSPTLSAISCFNDRPKDPPGALVSPSAAGVWVSWLRKLIY